jgi:hypothetical protein
MAWKPFPAQWRSCSGGISISAIIKDFLAFMHLERQSSIRHLFLHAFRILNNVDLPAFASCSASTGLCCGAPQHVFSYLEDLVAQPGRLFEF